MRQKTLSTNQPHASYPAILLICMLLALSGCATYPTQELSDARQAVQAAEAIQANKHMPSFYDKAKSSLTKAETQLNTNHPNFAIARDHALVAKDQAIKARLLTSAMLEAKSTIAKLESVDTPLTEAKEALEKAESAISTNNFDIAIKSAELAKNLALQGR